MFIYTYILFFYNNKLTKNEKNNTLEIALDIRIYKESLRILHS